MEVLNISITSDLSGFTPQGRGLIEERIAKIANEMTQEAARIEEGGRPPGVTLVEVTTKHVMTADEVVRGAGTAARRPSIRDALTAVLSAVSSAAAGTLAGMINSYWQAMLFGVSTATAVFLAWRTARRTP
ncbi:hypothetical protein [Frankia tisae]|uniref:hypothetical protein n=1 Tax=Frankia tisae TaxID=2950104 RepID=UPI0021BE79C0|nr:hypothetical protein [Frankia tisae]